MVLSFQEVLLRCAGERELVIEFDRLHGANLSRKGSGLDLMIDDASGRTQADLQLFAAFVWEFVWLPLVDVARSDVG